jgi:hypothetical protein
MNYAIEKSKLNIENFDSAAEKEEPNKFSKSQNERNERFDKRCCFERK